VGHIQQRHRDLVYEMLYRGMNHKSKMNNLLRKYKFDNFGKVDIQKSMADLFARCPDCKKKFEERKQ